MGNSVKLFWELKGSSNKANTTLFRTPHLFSSQQTTLGQDDWGYRNRDTCAITFFCENGSDDPPPMTIKQESAASKTSTKSLTLVKHAPLHTILSHVGAFFTSYAKLLSNT